MRETCNQFEGVNISILAVRIRCKSSIWFHFGTQTAWNSQFLEIFFRCKKKKFWIPEPKRSVRWYFFVIIRFLSVNEPEGRAAKLTSLVKVLFSWGVRHRHFVNNFLRKFAVPFSRQENWPLSDSFELQFSFWNSLLMYHSISANKLELKTVYKKQRFHHLKKYGQKTKTLEKLFSFFKLKI